MNILRRPPLAYYSPNFEQHRNLYDFSTNTVNILLDNFYQVYQHGNKENKIQAYAEIINQQQGEIVIL